MANHHGITFDEQRKRYIIGPITVSIDEMTNALNPVELAAIINKKHHAIINGKKFKTSRAISCHPLIVIFLFRQITDLNLKHY